MATDFRDDYQRSNKVYGRILARINTKRKKEFSFTLLSLWREEKYTLSRVAKSTKTSFWRVKMEKYVYLIVYENSIVAAYSSKEMLELAKKEIEDEEGMNWEKLEEYGYLVKVCRLNKKVYK